MHTPLGAISDAKLEAIVDDMAGLVRETTGLSLDTSNLEVKLLDSRALMRRAEADALQSMGPGFPEPKGVWAKFGERYSALVERLGVSGMYLPTENAVLLNRDQFERKGLDALRKTIFHELLHAAQFQSYPILKASMRQAFQAAITMWRVHGKHSQEFKDAKDTFSARLSFLEGHAAYMEKKVQAHFPHSDDITTREIGAALLYLLSFGVGMPLGQYERGARTFEKLMKAPDGPELIDRAYQNPSLVDLLLKERGEKR